MKIAFWSNVRKKTGVTTNMACIAAMTSIAGMGKTILLENHYSLHSLGNILLAPEQITSLKEQGQYYDKYGIEYVLKQIYSGHSGSDLIRQISIPLLYTNMYYLPQSYIVNREVFNYEFDLVREELFRSLEEISDYVFIDTETNQNLSSNTILSDADMIVVNLRQDPVMLDEFFENYSSVREKAVYLLGEYQPEIAWNLRRICYRYRISRDQIGVVPYNIELEESMNQGRVLQFLNRNYYKASGRENDYFMRQVRKASLMVRQNLLKIRRMQPDDMEQRVSGLLFDKNARYNGNSNNERK